MIAAPATAPVRRRRPGTRRRRNTVVVELLAITGLYLILFWQLVGPIRHVEIHSIAEIFGLFGSRGVSGIAARDAIFIAPHGHKTPIVATMTASCSSLMGILALGALAFAVLRGRRLHTLVAYIAAAALLYIANTLRMAASAYAGLAFGQAALILFHNWVGTLWNFAATLLGFLLMLYLTLPTLERAEQDRRGRHSAHRPESWARSGLGYRVPMLAGTRRRRRSPTGWLVRHFLPSPVRRRMAATREESRVDYRVGFLDVEQRKQAIIRLAADGLEAHGATLLAIATYEEDTSVLDTLATQVVGEMPKTATKSVDALLAYWTRGWHGARHPGEPPEPIAEGTWRLLLGRLGRRRTLRDIGRLAGIQAHPSEEALVRLVNDGLEYNKFTLLNLAATETDPATLGILAQEIATRQWEPTVSPAVTALRLFARGWLTKPVEPARQRRGAPPAAAGPVPAAERKRLAVTGAGSQAGLDVCRLLVAAGHEVVGIDADPHATALSAGGVRLVAGLPADDEQFATRILEIVSAEHPDAIVSTVPEELERLIPIGEALTGHGCAHWFPPASALALCTDRARFAITMEDYGVPHPPTATKVRETRNLPSPWFVRPRKGPDTATLVTDSRRRLLHALKENPDQIVQSQLLGDAWGADVLVDRNGLLVGCVPTWRIESRGDVLVKGTTFDSQDVTRVCAEALAAVGFAGVAHVRGVLDPTGHAAVIEIEPQLSNSLPLSQAAGSDIVGAYLQAIFHPDRLITPVFFRPGATMVRHFAEAYEGAPEHRNGATPDRRLVAVTGAGGPAGFNVCKALLDAGHDVIGIDPDPLSAAFRLPRLRGVIGFRADDEHFAARIVEIVSDQRPDAIISTVAEEFAALVPLTDQLSALGCASWFPPLGSVGACNDKARFAAALENHAVPTAPTATSVGGLGRVPAPWVVKPKSGRGSRGVVFTSDRSYVRGVLKEHPDMIVQSRLVGNEWTADVLVDRDGTLVGCVSRWRDDVSGGISVKGTTFEREDVRQACAAATAAVGFNGVANVQGIVDPTGNAPVAVIEINPRFSGGLPLSLAAGSNLVGAYLDAILHPDAPITPLTFRAGTTMVRYFDESFEYRGAIDEDVEPVAPIPVLPSQT